eukprot:6185094-Pyramimonas_sp.AAC.1
MKIMGWPASACPPTRRSAGSTKAGAIMTCVAGIHCATPRGATTAKLLAPKGTRAPGRPPTLSEETSR